MDQQPQRLGEVLSQLFTSRGWGRQQERLQVEEAWREAAGEAAARSQVLAWRKGVLEIQLQDAVLMHELAQFQKSRLVAALNTLLGPGRVKELRFRLGSIR
jgi:predicted nucleic acid-binding Zn ribbon protein